jgi:L-fuconolactonase
MIDAHQHVWEIGRNGCAWPTDAEGAIFRDYSLDDFRRHALRDRVTATILVQSQEDECDTDWLLDLAAREDLVAAVVGWTDLAAPQARERIAELASRPKLVGLRPMVQQREADWYDAPELEPAFSAMTEHRLALDALVRTTHLASLDRLAPRFPDLRIVIDHAAKPAIDDQLGFEEWYATIAPLAKRPNVSCKLSGLLTECGSAPPEAIEPYVAATLALFGPDRVMWGSDWPVLELVSTYSEWLRIARRLVPEAMHDAVFGGTAQHFYRLDVKVTA